jgi:hypothetical protein
MPIGAATFNIAYSALPDLRAQLRVNRREIVERCLVAALGGERVSTDQGLAVTPDVEVRLLTADVPARGCGYGSKVELSRDAGTTWAMYRIDGISESAGMTMLAMESEHGG